MPIDANTTLHDRYRIGRLHKLGTRGAVYQATDLKLGVSVAVKENLVSGEPDEAAFKHEAAFVAMLRHPNIVRGIDFFADETGQFIVMDFVEGENLSEWITHTMLPASDLLPMLEGVFQALSYLHARKPAVIHRDVEPSNLILTPRKHVVLVDFGFAKLLSPDQPKPRTDQKSDEYSLAATIYFLVTCQPPVDSLERHIGKQAFVAARSLNPSVPEHIDAALERALATNADDRYPDVQTFWRALSAGA
jgi:serine/threonine protein kinase